MEITKKLGIGIVMIIPAFVISGALWAIFKNYVPIAIWVIIMVFIYRQVIAGKIKA